MPKSLSVNSSYVRRGSAACRVRREERRWADPQQATSNTALRAADPRPGGLLPESPPALLRGLAYQAADDLKDVLCPEDESGKTGGRDAELGRPNLILAEGFQATLRRFKRLRQTGDRLQAALPGPPERWGMLAPLRVTLPTSPQMVLQPLVSSAV